MVKKMALKSCWAQDKYIDFQAEQPIYQKTTYLVFKNEIDYSSIFDLGRRQIWLLNMNSLKLESETWQVEELTILHGDQTKKMESVNRVRDSNLE